MFGLASRRRGPCLFQGKSMYVWGKFRPSIISKPSLKPALPIRERKFVCNHFGPKPIGDLCRVKHS